MLRATALASMDKAVDKGCEPESIVEVLECVEDAASTAKRVTIADIIDHIGDGAFPPLMLLPALAMISPLTAIFGVATAGALIIALVAIQMVLGRQTLWLPNFILTTSISSRKLDRVTGWFSRPAEIVDGVTDRRLSFLVRAPFDRLWALLCLALALVVPVLEFVPMSATIVASAIALFALAMLARDGLLAILGLIVLGGAFWLVWSLAT
jgi:hypothetical protein